MLDRVKNPLRDAARSAADDHREALATSPDASSARALDALVAHVEARPDDPRVRYLNRHFLDRPFRSAISDEAAALLADLGYVDGSFFQADTAAERDEFLGELCVRAAYDAWAIVNEGGRVQDVAPLTDSDLISRNLRPYADFEMYGDPEFLVAAGLV